MKVTNFFIILFLFLFILGYSSENKYVEIEVHNTFGLDAKAEIKCDWDGKKYAYYNLIKLPARKDYRLRVPSNLKKCELWPSIDW